MIKRASLFFFALSLFLHAEDAPYTKKVKLAWDEVEGSQAYELEIYVGNALFRKETTTQLSWETRLEPGIYRYRVRAIDEFSRFGRWTPFEEFAIKPKEIILERAVVRNANVSSVEIALAYGFYDYRSEISGFGFGKADGATEFGLEADFHYWFFRRLGLGLGASYTRSELGSVSVNYPELSASILYSVFNNTSFYFNPLLSFEYQNTAEIASMSTSLSTLEAKLISTNGIGLGAELGIELSPAWAVGAWLRYVNPISFSGSNVQNGVADSSTFYKYGFGVSYCFKPKWSAGLEYTNDYRKVSYQSQNSRTNLYKDSSKVSISLKTLFGDTQ